MALHNAQMHTGTAHTHTNKTTTKHLCWEAHEVDDAATTADDDDDVDIDDIHIEMLNNLQHQRCLLATAPKTNN